MSPSGQKLSVNDFKKQLETDLQRIASDNGWNLSKNADKGRAFQHWCAELIFRAEPNYDSPIEDVALYSNDLGSDLVVPDETNRQLLICQTKYRSPQTPVDEGEVNDFFHRHDKYMDRRWVLEFGDAYSASALADYKEYIDNGWKIDYRFITTGLSSDRVRELADQCTEEYESRKLTLSFELMDFPALKEYYVRSLSLEEAIPDEVELDLRQGLFFTRDEPFETLIAVVKGNTLRGLYKKYRHSLYAFNIRGYLGNRGINSEIIDTAAHRPTDFFYFNNGVSAVCTDFSIEEGNHLTAKKLQIINGAQTVTSLAQQEPDARIEVLFRLTKTLSVATEKGINQDIIRFNNTQNAIKISDFRSNDRLQLFLERNLKLDKARGPLSPFHYIRKRSAGRRGVGFGVRLEDLAKIRYSFLYEPTLVHASPKLLWTLSDDDEMGSYNKAFGINGELIDVWTTDALDEAKFMIALHQRLLSEAKTSAARDAELRFMHRLRFHSLALCGFYLRELRRDQLAPGESLLSTAAFEQVLDEYWTVGRMLLIITVKKFLKGGGSLFAFVRSAEEWKDLTDAFRLQLHSTM